MKTMNAKIPIGIAQKLSDNAQLNASYLSGFLVLNYNRKPSDEALGGLNLQYSFKADDGLHKAVKLASVETGLPINELIGRLLRDYYA